MSTQGYYRYVYSAFPDPCARADPHILPIDVRHALGRAACGRGGRVRPLLAYAARRGVYAYDIVEQRRLVQRELSRLLWISILALQQALRVC
jgi:hypothetical protein